jgi:hypothetical protein
MKGEQCIVKLSVAAYLLGDCTKLFLPCYAAVDGVKMNAVHNADRAQYSVEECSP